MIKDNIHKFKMKEHINTHTSKLILRHYSLCLAIESELYSLPMARSNAEIKDKIIMMNNA